MTKKIIALKISLDAATKVFPQMEVPQGMKVQGLLRVIGATAVARSYDLGYERGGNGEFRKRGELGEGNYVVLSRNSEKTLRKVETYKQKYNSQI